MKIVTTRSQLILLTVALLFLPSMNLFAQTEEAGDTAREETSGIASDAGTADQESAPTESEQNDEERESAQQDALGSKDSVAGQQEMSETLDKYEGEASRAPASQLPSRTTASQQVEPQIERPQPRTRTSSTETATPATFEQKTRPVDAEILAENPVPQKIASEQNTPEESDEILREVTALVTHLSPWKIMLIVSILVLIYFTNVAVTLYLGRLSARRAEYSPWLRKGIPFVTFALWVITFFLIAALLTPTRVTAFILIGILIAVAIFASHQLVRDFIAGVMILLERPFQIGDRIQIGDHYGEVVRIGLRAFHVRSPEGSLLVIPNGEIMSNAVANVNPGTMEGQVVTELYMPPDIEIEEARRIAFEATAVSPYVFIHKPIEVYVDEEYKEQLLIKVIVKAFVFDAKYENNLRSDIVELARKGFQTKSQRSTEPGTH